MIGTTTHFAWLPVRLSHFVYPWWRDSMRYAWLRRVRRTQTLWGDVLYSELQ